MNDAPGRCSPTVVPGGDEHCTCGHLRTEHGPLAICLHCGCQDFCRAEAQGSPILRPEPEPFAHAPLARLLALIPRELQSVKVEQGAGALFRVTCVRPRGTPLTTLDQDLNTALRLALQELAP